MTIDTTTFVLELINFAVLVWVLNRFLFTPIRAVMETRRQAIDKATADAEALKAEAAQLKSQYEGRLTTWAKEQETARAALNKELAAQQAQGLAAAKKAAEQEQQRLAKTAAKQQAAWQRSTERQALRQAAQFAAQLLTRLAGPSLDAKLLDVFLADLAARPKAELTTLRAAAKKAVGHVAVRSARRLTAAQQQALTATLSKVLGLPCTAAYTTDKALLAGLRVTVDGWVLQADLAGELAFFAAGAGHED